MRARLGLVQVVAGPAGDDLFLMLQVMIEHLAKGEHLRLAIHKRQHDRAEGVLQLGMLVEIIEHHGGVHVALELNDDAHAHAVRLIADIADALELLVVYQFRDLGNQRRLVDHVRNLGDNDALAVVCHRLDIGLGAHDDAAAAGGISVIDAPAAQDQAASREVWSLDTLHEFLIGRIRLRDQLDHAVDDLAEIMRRDVGRHTDGDAGGTIDQQVRIARRHDDGLHERFVKVWREIDRFLVDICEHLKIQLAHARLGVSHGGGAVTVDRAEVALAIHQRIARGKILRQAHQRAVNGGVAVRMILTQNVADDTRALTIRLIRRDAQLVHGIENAAVNRLEAVAHIGQRAGNDDRHRVGDEGRLHLVFQVDRADTLDIRQITGQIVLEIQRSFLLP